MNVRKLRVGVIGTGAFARACHVPGLLGHPQAEVVTVCGRHRKRTQALADDFAIPAITLDPDELCSGALVDAVTICTPTEAHSRHALLALRHGKHVFCEKPLALTVREATEMAVLARTSGVVHQIGFTYRHLFGVQELRQRLKNGELGEPFLLRANHKYFDSQDSETRRGWRHKSAEAGGGVLYETGAHLFDLARILMGQITAVRAELQFLRRPAVKSDDVASVGVRYASGARGEWFATRLSPAHEPNFVQVVGPAGALKALISRGAADGLSARVGSDWERLYLPAGARDGHPHALGRMMRSFVDACLQGALCVDSPSFDDGLAVQRLIAAAEEAARSGSWIALDPPA